MTSSEKLKLLRAHYGLTQVELADLLSLSPSYISKIEVGKQEELTDNVIKSISNVLGCNERWLRTGEGEMITAPAKDTNKGIVGRIIALREKNRLSMDDFAAELGFSRQLQWLVETGRQRPTKSYLRRVADTFNVNYMWLVIGEDKGKDYEDVEGEIIKIDKWIRENPDARKRIMQMMESSG